MISSSPVSVSELHDHVALSEVLADTPTAARKRLAHAIRSADSGLFDDWISRHRRHPILASHVLEALDSWDRYRSAYLVPLLFVLERALRTGQLEYFHIYSAERTRFFDDARLARGGWEELEAILFGDRTSLIALAGDDPHLAASFAAILAAVDAGILHRDNSREVQLALIGDCLMLEIKAFLKPALAAEAVTLGSSHFYFSARMGYDLRVTELESSLSAGRFDLLALSFFTFEGIPLYTSLLREADDLSDADLAARCEGLLALVHTVITQIRSATDTTILLHGCSGLPLGRIRRYLPLVPAFSNGHAKVAARLSAGLQELAEATENVLFLDEQAIVSTVGARRANRRHLPRRITHSATFHYSAIGGLFASAYREVVDTYLLLSHVKVLLVDFDNTLWSGVMAEGHVTHNTDAQLLLKQLRESGILLVALSKNDPARIRWDEMALAPEDFALLKISWQPKPQSVAEAAHQLDLDPASFVLIDDNPVERELVHSQFPTVAAMDGASACTWERLRMMLSFNNTRRTAEAEHRTMMYREAAERRGAIAGAVDYPSMMRSLGLESQWRQATKADLDRVHELLSRTNQFNTTTMRLTLPELATMFDAPDVTIHLATLSDKFGKLGVVGVVITRCAKGLLFYDSVVMSCRAMGFGLESLLLRGPMDSVDGVTSAVGRYIATERNSPCAGLFRDAGFKQGSNDEWTLDLSGPLPEAPDWLRVERG
jgi:FkbH-like protein